MLLVVALAATAHSTVLLGRRAAVTGGLGCATLLQRRAAFAIEAPNSQCLSCKLKDQIAGNAGQLALGTDIGDLLAAAPQFAVRDVVDVGNDPTKFGATMRSTLSKYDPEKFRLLVWVQSELEGGVPWCPDTRAALPLLEGALNRARGERPIVLVVADVVRRDYFSATYPYRTSSQLRLQGVPTLYRWGRDGPVQSLQERQITPDALDALIA